MSAACWRARAFRRCRCFPQYREVQELAGVERVHPADLWIGDGTGATFRPMRRAAPQVADQLAQHALEQQLLKVMRSTGGARQRAAFERISDLCAGLGAGAPQPQAALPWKLAAAMFEALAQGLLRPGRLQQARRVAPAAPVPPARGRADRGLGAPGPRPALLLRPGRFARRRPPGAAPGCRPPGLPPGPPHAGRLRQERARTLRSGFDRAGTQARRRRQGSLGRRRRWRDAPPGPGSPSSSRSSAIRCAASTRAAQLLADELQTTVTQTQHAAAAPPAALAMEVATSLLYLDASLEDADFDDARQRERVLRLAERVAAVREGQPPQPLEAWMEELVPPCLRPPDAGQRGARAARVAVRVGEADRPVLPPARPTRRS